MIGNQPPNKRFDTDPQLGHADGRNIVIDVRWAGDSPDDLPRLAASLVTDRANAIIGTCIPSTRAAKGATRTIPVVMSVDGDPVAADLIASFARPGGNVTATQLAGHIGKH